MIEGGVLVALKRLQLWFKATIQRAPLSFVPIIRRQARVLIDTTQALADMPDVAQLMTTILDQLSLVVPSTSAAIHLIEGDRQRLIAARLFPANSPSIGSSWLRDTLPLTDMIAKTRAPLHIQDVRLDPRWRYLAGIDYIRSWLGVPLVVRDELLGFLMLDRDRPIGFRQSEIEVVKTVATQLAVALHLANLAEIRQRQISDLAALYDLSRVSNASLNLDELLPLLVERLQSLVGVLACSIMLVDEDGDLQPAVVTGAQRGVYQKMKLDPQEPSLGREVLRSKAPLLVPDTSRSSMVNPRIHSLFQSRSLLAIPLLAHGEGIGVAIFSDDQEPHRFDENTIRNAEVAANQVALAIANSRLFEATQRHARELALRDRVRMAIAAAPLEIVSIAQQLTKSLAETFGYAYIFCWAPQEHHFGLVSASDEVDSRLQQTMPLDRGICAQVFRTGVPCLVSDVQVLEAGDQADQRMSTQRIVSEICVPIRSNHVVLLLHVQHNQRLYERDLRMLVEIVAQVGLAFENVQLVHEIERVQSDMARSARMAAVGTLAAGVAHEFNNMLAAMAGYSQLGLAGTVAERIEALELVLTLARRGKYLTGSLLTFASAETQHRLVTDLDDIVDQGIDAVANDLSSLSIHVQRRRRDGLLVLVDPYLLVQVVVHLLTNARDAMLAGGVLTVRTDASDGFAELIISDTGHGIPAEIRDRLFEPFVTTKGAFGGGNQGGVGLGLSICYSIVHAHGGSISVESTSDQGSSFIVRLPLHVSQASHATNGYHSETSQRVLRVLIVDDETVIQAIVRAVLTRNGHHVLLASTAESAYALIRQGGIDIVICDLHLPGLSGLELAQRLQDEASRPLFVLMSGRLDGIKADDLREAPIDAILPKPFHAHDITKLLETLMGVRPVERTNAGDAGNAR